MTEQIAKLVQFYVFAIDSPLTNEKRKAVDAQIDHIASVFQREVSHRWVKRGDERLLRVIVDPVTIEIVFHDDRVELFGAAPAWARLFFTKARKLEVKEKIEFALRSAGFITEAVVEPGSSAAPTA